MAFFTLVYSSKESSLELALVGPLGLNGFLSLVLLVLIFHPYESWPLFSGWWWVMGWGVFLVKFLLFPNLFRSCLPRTYEKDFKHDIIVFAVPIEYPFFLWHWKPSLKSYKYLKFSYKDDIDIKVINISDIDWNIDHKIPEIEVNMRKNGNYVDITI